MSEADAEAQGPHNEYTFTREEYDELVRRLGKEQLSKRSEYEEVELVEDCTLYDMYRQPRAPVTDAGASKTLPVRVLNADLTCPICLGIIRQTTVVMECLHRFCRDCIQKSLRLTNKECPSCRIHIPSKRSLRDDLNFDALIQKIYPNVDEFEEKENHLIEEINRERHFHNAFTESAKIGARHQASIRRQGGKKKPAQLPTPAAQSAKSTDPRSASPSPPGRSTSDSSSSAAVGDKRSAPEAIRGSPPSASNSLDHATSSQSESSNETDRESPRKKPRQSDSSASTTGSSTPTAASAPAAKASSAPVPPDRVNLRVMPHPEEAETTPKLERSLFTTSYRLKIRQLKKHLYNLLKVDGLDTMRIVLPADNCSLSGLTAAVASGESAGAVIRKDLLFDQELEDYMSIYDIYQQYGMGTKWELRLQYHFSDSIVNGIAQFVTSGSKP